MEYRRRQRDRADLNNNRVEIFTWTQKVCNICNFDVSFARDKGFVALSDQRNVDEFLMKNIKTLQKNSQVSQRAGERGTNIRCEWTYTILHSTVCFELYLICLITPWNILNHSNILELFSSSHFSSRFVTFQNNSYQQSCSFLTCEHLIHTNRFDCNLLLHFNHFVDTWW